ncbi:multidrug ABC transporter ATP-binding protein [Sphaerisporangium siamense]|uniref:ABC-2 type transport system ATP-binding protein n=1 Tax=Sphaerisporangium siamense TaxID=795645 RepID=A0A7W7DEI2_9ACTN|nr:ATP-binding cassette domain-containing protein [Sphaerisporangium siamense]MBB4703878.1 ABC-2 type transport system ATP-binding protein [Sphaerisporangium siamense]GII82347.1 multidrug ABC transporter ATP-binding protein [Sphaerisporangium siamense]
MTGVEVRDLTKTFGRVTAVDHLTFTVRPGAVTAFLGPNGAGKTTTMRMMIDHVAPTSGGVAIGGRRYRELPQPTAVVGAAFDTASFHPRHTAWDHLRIYATMGGHPVDRVPRLLDLVGLAGVARRRTGAFSTGMRQRLNLATALLGDPTVLLLDEPGNGLDPEGMTWLRSFLRGLADEGRTVLVSSHALGEMQQIADDVVVIRQGRLLGAGPLRELSGAAPAVLVRTPDGAALSRILARQARAVEADGPDDLRVHGLEAAAIADLAAAHGLRVHGLTSHRPSLEQLFLDLTGERTNA